LSSSGGSNKKLTLSPSDDRITIGSVGVGGNPRKGTSITARNVGKGLQTQSDISLWFAIPFQGCSVSKHFAITEGGEKTKREPNTSINGKFGGLGKGPLKLRHGAKMWERKRAGGGNRVQRPMKKRMRIRRSRKTLRKRQALGGERNSIPVKTKKKKKHRLGTDRELGMQ